VITLKDYVYISDTKVDVLFGQIDERMLENIAATLGLNLGVFKVEFRGDMKQRYEHRVQRLAAVVAYLEKSCGFGTVDEPDAYIKESNLNMKWAEIESALFFGAVTDRTVVGLGGSVMHLRGHTGAGMTPASHTPALLRHLKGVVAEDENRPAPPAESLDDDSLDVVEQAVRGMRGPREPMEFVAKRLLYGRTHRRAAGKDIEQRVLLATPLYVAHL
jgi:hypothetical protein